MIIHENWPWNLMIPTPVTCTVFCTMYYMHFLLYTDNYIPWWSVFLSQTKSSMEWQEFLLKLDVWFIVVSKGMRSIWLLFSLPVSTKFPRLLLVGNEAAIFLPLFLPMDSKKELALEAMEPILLTLCRSSVANINWGFE